MAGRSRGFIHYCERLFLETDAPVRSTRLWHEPGTTASTVHQWIRHLRFHRVMTPVDGGHRIDRVRLLQVLAAHRIARIQPVHEGAVALDARGFSQVLSQRRIPHALCMLSAANEWTFFEPRYAIDVYVRRADAPRVRALTTVGRYRVNLYAENLGEVPTRERDGVPITDLFQTLIDCRAHPEGGAHAQFLERVLLDRAKVTHGAAAR
ncbi:MAG: hypothetical protein HY556_02495 [Euryarchaeota archaeon]|nr:hypothetical protein [Euryarchaeota archaeon]